MARVYNNKRKLVDAVSLAWDQVSETVGSYDTFATFEKGNRF